MKPISVFGPSMPFNRMIPEMPGIAGRGASHESRKPLFRRCAVRNTALLRGAATIVLMVLIGGFGSIGAQQVPSLAINVRTAPPPSPGIIYPEFSEITATPALSASAKTPYSIGELTDDEQAYVELINRARLDPVTEGQRLVNTSNSDVLASMEFFDVDLDKLLNDPEEGFNHLPPAAVLVPNASLTAAARVHTQDMFANTFQGHQGSDGKFFGDRVVAQRYAESGQFGGGENVFSTADSVFHGHAGFNVDWGGGPSYSPSEFIDIDSIAARLNTLGDAVSAFVAANLSTGAQELVANFTGSEPESDALRSALAQELVNLINKRDGQGDVISIYDDQRFADVALSQETIDLLVTNPTSHHLIGLNRYLLDDAYPTEIEKTSWEPGGIQNPPGHRLSIHNESFKEIGVGVFNGSKADVMSGTPGGRDVGPQLVTQVFGVRPNIVSTIAAFITGVAYYDLNGNQFYDAGESIGAVDVQVDGSSFFATTLDSGGYGVPVPANGSYQITFSGDGFATETVDVTIAGNNNVKVDFVPTYLPPTISGPDLAALNQNNTFTFLEVAGATAYQWKYEPIKLFVGVEGAETGLDDFEVLITGTYSVRDSTTKATGGHGFRLVHSLVDNRIEPQFLTWNREFRPGANGIFKFKSRLRFAWTSEVARVEISSDGGNSWVEVWSQAGLTTDFQNGIQETSFSDQSVDLSSYAGEVIQIRFAYDFTGGTIFGPNPDVGWFFDDLELTDTREVVDPIIADVTGDSSFDFNPMTPDDFSLQVRPMVGGRWFPFGPEKEVTAQEGDGGTDPVIHLTNIAVTGGQATIAFDVIAGSASSFDLLSASAPTGPWVADGSAVIIPNGNGFLAIASTNNADESYYQVSGQ